MRLPEIGYRIRQARLALGLTQVVLAKAAGIGRVTLVQLEGGLLKDLGIVKVLALAEAVGLELTIAEAPHRRAPDRVAIATTAANVGFRSTITEEDLVVALLTGRLPAKGRPNLRRLFEDSSPELVRALFDEVGRWSKPGRLASNIEKLARQLGIPESKVEEWMKAA